MPLWIFTDLSKSQCMNRLSLISVSLCGNDIDFIGQYANAPAPICSMFCGRTASSCRNGRAIQFENARFPMDFNWVGSSSVSSELQYSKQWSGICVKWDGILILFSDLQLANTPFPNLVTDSGILISWILDPMNARSSIVVSDSGNFNSWILLSWNALFPIVVSDSGSFNISISHD